MKIDVQREQVQHQGLSGGGQEQLERRRKERRQGRCFVWTEKRSGFDNRRRQLTGKAVILALPRQMAVAMRDQPGLLVKVLVLFNIYNLADYFMTVKALAAGHKELNPVMRYLFEVDPLLAGIFKVVTGVVTTVLIWRCRRFRLMLQFSLVALGIYVALIAYHLYGVFSALA